MGRGMLSPLEADNFSRLSGRKTEDVNKNIWVYSELVRAATMAVEPRLRQILYREILTDLVTVRLQRPAAKTKQFEPSVALIGELSGDIDATCLLRVPNSQMEYLHRRVSPAKEMGDEPVRLLARWIQSWFGTVADLLATEIRCRFISPLDLTSPVAAAVPFEPEEVVVITTFTWTFADGKTILPELWLPVTTVQELISLLQRRAGGSKLQLSQNLREGVARTYQQVRQERGESRFLLPAEFPPLERQEQKGENNGLALLRDVCLEIVAELGRTEMKIGELLELEEGSLIRLDKMAGDPVDLHLNGQAIARGEVLVVEDNLGVRISEIVSPAEQVGRLQ